MNRLKKPILIISILVFLVGMDIFLAIRLVDERAVSPEKDTQTTEKYLEPPANNIGSQSKIQIDVDRNIYPSQDPQFEYQANAKMLSVYFNQKKETDKAWTLGIWVCANPDPKDWRSHHKTDTYAFFDLAETDNYTVKDNIITYHYDDIDIQFEVLLDRVQRTIIVKSDQAVDNLADYLTYNALFNNLSPKTIDSRQLGLDDGNNTGLYVQSMKMRDSSRTKTKIFRRSKKNKEKYAYITAQNQKEDVHLNNNILELKVDWDWLRDEDRVFPIYINDEITSWQGASSITLAGKFDGGNPSSTLYDSSKSEFNGVGGRCDIGDMAEVDGSYDVDMIDLDLGSSYIVDRIVVDSNGADYIGKYFFVKVQYWNGSGWVDFGGTDEIPKGDGCGVYTHDFSSITARNTTKVRINVRATFDVWNCFINEIEVYGTLEAPTPLYRSVGTTATALATGEPAIAVDAVSTNKGTSSPITVSHTTSGANRLMLVGISVWGLVGVEGVSSIKYNNVDLTLVGTESPISEERVWLYKLKAPDTGTHDLVVTFSAPPVDGAVVGVITFTGVDQTTPLGTYAGNTGNSNEASVNVSSASGELVFDTIFVYSGSAATVGALQTQRWNETQNDAVGTGSTEPGAATVTMSWDFSGYDTWGICAVPIKPSGTNGLTISGSTATFDSGLPDNIGVGDVIQYDSDDNGSIDALAFIHGRTSSTVYTVKNKLGIEPTQTTVEDNDWEIYRAYNSLANWQALDENDTLDNSVEDFDTSRDITGFVMNVACYGDGADTTAVDITGWTTSSSNYIKIYTPYSLSEVGSSQRHDGTWDTGKYRLEVASNSSAISDSANYIRIEGLQVSSTVNAGSDDVIYFGVASAGEVWVSKCIIKGVFSGTANNLAGISSYNASASLVVKVWDNILYDFIFGTANVMTVYNNTATTYAYNNTLQNVYQGFYRDGGTFVVKNNIVQDASNAGYLGTFVSSDYNISNLTNDAPSPSYRPNQATTVTFADKDNDDFHLDSTDTFAKDQGTDLSDDLNLPFSDDIDTHYRGSSWDIGADEYADAGCRFEYQRQITLNYSERGSTCGSSYDLSHFPVLINLSGDWLKTVANGGKIYSPEGYDIIFRDSSLGPYTVPSDCSNRLLVFVTGFENSGDRDVTNVTFNGVGMTPAVEDVVGTTTVARTEIWYLEDASLPASGSFVVTYSGGSPSYPMHAYALFCDVDQTAPIYEHTASNPTTTLDPVTATVNTVDGGMAIAGVTCGNSGSYVWGNGWTEGTDQTHTSTTTMSTAHHATTAPTDTASADFQGTMNRQVLVVMSIRPSSGGGTGELVAWVRIPDLFADNKDTNIYMYYANQCVSSITENPTGVWDTNFKGVWHLHDDYEDSTSNKNDGTNYGSDDDTGQIANGQDFDGATDYIQTTSDELKTEDNFTISLWFNADATDFSHHMIWQGDATGNGWGEDSSPYPPEMHISFGNYVSPGSTGNLLSFFLGDRDEGVGDPLNITTAFTDTTNWHLVVVTVSNMSSPTPSATMYLDGSLVDSDTGDPSHTGRTGWDTDLKFGRPGTSTRYFDGVLDEVRISNTDRDDCWIGTEFNNMDSPSTFYTLGPEEGTDFEHRRPITLNYSQIGSTCGGSYDLSNFPVLINLSEDWLKTKANGGDIYSSDGYDIVFRDSNGITLDHEIEYYSGGSGEVAILDNWTEPDTNDGCGGCTGWPCDGAGDCSYTPSAGSNRLLVFIWNHDDYQFNPVNPDVSVTFGGVSMTKAVTHYSEPSANWFLRTSIFYLAEEDWPGGSPPWDFIVSGGDSCAGNNAAHALYSGVDQNNPIVDTGVGDSDMSTYIVTSSSFNVVADGLAIGSAQNSSSSAGNDWSGNTPPWTEVIDVSFCNSMASYANTTSVYASDGTDTVTVESGWDEAQNLAVASLRPATSAGTLVAWVRIPDLFAGQANTNIYIYYGSPSITSPTENPEGVWDDNYVGVWHLKETGTGAAGEYKDSTQYANHGRGGGGTPGSELNITGNITVEAWVQLQDVRAPTNGASIVGKREQYFLFQDWDADYRITFTVDTSTQNYVSANGNSPNTWYHMVGVYDGTNLRIYRNGSQVGSLPTSGSITVDNYGVEIGRHPNNDPFNGPIDEVRISDTDRDSCWIGTEFSNMDDPGTFHTLGNDEPLGPTVVELASFTKLCIRSQLQLHRCCCYRREALLLQA